MRCNTQLPLRQKAKESHTRNYNQRIPNQVLHKLADPESPEYQHAFSDLVNTSPFSQAAHASTSPVSPVQLADSCTKRPSLNSSKVAKEAPLYRRNTKPRPAARSTRHNEVFPRGRHGFFVNEQAKVLSFLNQRLSQIYQGALKYFAQNLIAAICPRKRHRYPYRKGKAPPYWPDFGDYTSGPHHQQKPDLVPLMVYLMRLYWTADDFDRFNDPKKDDSTKLKAGWSSFLEATILHERSAEDKLPSGEGRAPAIWATMREVLAVLRAEYDWLCERTDGMAWFEFDNTDPFELPEVMESHPHCYIRVPGQPSLSVDGFDDIEVPASTSDCSPVEALTPDSPASEIDVKRRVSSASGDSISPLDSDHGSSAFYVGNNDSARSLPDKKVAIKADPSINNPFNFDHWTDLDDLVLQSQPQAFMADMMYGQGHLELVQQSDYMTPLNSCTPDHMAPSYILQFTQPQVGADCYGFDAAAPLPYSTFMDPYSAPLPADYGCCGQQIHEQAQAQHLANMPLMMSSQGNNMITGHEWAMNQQHMAFTHGQILPSNAGPMPAPHAVYGYGGQQMPFNASHIPRSFDTSRHRPRIVSR